MKKLFLIALILCSVFPTAWADGWKLTDTKVKGTGGFWENGQKVRVDCSYKKGVFKYERKVTNGTKMDVYNSNAEFEEPKQNYAPGENISVRIAFSHQGEKLNYAPYAKITVNGYPATDASGRNTVTPPETVTLQSQTPSSGEQMTIVYACNGMEVIYTYEWDGKMVATTTNFSQENESTEETAFNEVSSWEEETKETVVETNETWGSHDTEIADRDVDETSYEEDLDEEDEEEWYVEKKRRPIVKYIIVIGIAAILIALILFLFKDKKNKTTEENNEIMEDEKPMMETPKQHACPYCGEPITEGDRFCEKCGAPLQPKEPKSTITYGLTILMLVALLQGCGVIKDTHSPQQSLLKSASTKGVKMYTLSNMDSKTLSKDDTKQLNALAREIKDMESYQVTVIGHADNTGTSEVNEAVSVNRARLVADYLKKKGVKNITSSGESYNHPVAGNDTPAGRAKNRRVEIYVSTVGKYNPYK